MRFGTEKYPPEGTSKLVRTFALIPTHCIDKDGTYIWVWLEYYYQRLQCTKGMYGKKYWIYNGKYTI